MLVKLIADLQPAGIVVAFDKGKVTFRNADYPEYKAQRKPTPSELSEQFPAAREVLEALGITMLEIDGFEADDIIGTLAIRVAGDQEILIVTGDRDLLQLVNPQVHVLLTRKGISEFEEVDPVALIFNYGLTAAQVIEMKGLMGDSSDNIPGVPGVGEKTAKKLIDDFGSIDGVYENIDQISGEKLKEKLLANRDLAYLSKKLATIECNVPIQADIAQYQVKPDLDKVRAVAEKYEFRALPAKIANWIFATAPTEPTGPIDRLESATEARQPVLPIETAAQFAQWAERVRRQGILFFIAETVGSMPDITISAAAIAAEGQTAYLSAKSAAWPQFMALLADPSLAKVTHDAKLVFNACHAGKIDFGPLLFDTMVAAYLINPSGNGYSPEQLAVDFLGLPADPEPLKNGRSPNRLAWEAGLLVELYAAQQSEIEKIGAGELWKTIELPLIETLSRMETSGIQLDRQALDAMDVEIAARIQVLLKEIYQLAGESFNVNSTKQLGLILFEKLGLPVGRKTKTGYSTDVEVLESLAGTHPMIDHLLEYRMLTKLKSTYLDGLRPLIRMDTGRVHTHFNQTVTATGRLSSSSPNLQNIPIRTELGRKIRNLFVPGPGYDWLVAADYSQIELRILAHLAGDENMIRSFLSGEDIHTRTAAEVFGVPIEQVTPDQRSRAKAVNFGIVYGISDYGLSQDIGVSRKEAGEYIAGYFARYPAVRAFIDSTIMEARMTGYVSTLFGRRRYLPEINSSNYNLRSFAERTAMNTPVQGTAADIIKKAMITVQAELTARKLSSRMLLQVHDELVLEVVEAEISTVAEVLKTAMETAASLLVPLSVEVKKGPNWAQTK